MVGERRNGNLLVQLGPKQQAYPEELIRQSRTHDGQTEYLIRWSLQAVGDAPAQAAAMKEADSKFEVRRRNSSGCTSGESKTYNILMWMSTEDVYANFLRYSESDHHKKK
ncbi:Cullin-9 [Bagarius yarrelli]|uniref:Cullin-9 n=1 Tax=Bagarius yarrelli TaxID=175774 RepID=A0A556TR60_BAGYA|nr:Cullin-9 [Bagarius yarrelli]